jgi:GNAT superfamily N-acetyltransferase
MQNPTNPKTRKLLSDIYQFERRRAEPSDLSYVLDTWSRSLRPLWPELRNQEFHAAIRADITDKLESGFELTIAHPEGAPSVIWAWLCCHPDTNQVAFIYVRPDVRGALIATRLIEKTLGNGPLLTSSRLSVTAFQIKDRHPDRIIITPRF